MSNHKRFLDTAYAVALAGNGVGGKTGKNFRLGSVIVNRHRVIEAARYNVLKTHPKLLQHYQWPYLHAEAHAILSLGLDNCMGKTLYVVRVLRDNSWALAKPCNSCMSLIKEVGIKSIYYSVSGDNYESW